MISHAVVAGCALAPLIAWGGDPSPVGRWEIRDVRVRAKAVPRTPALLQSQRMSQGVIKRRAPSLIVRADRTWEMRAPAVVGETVSRGTWLQNRRLLIMNVISPKPRGASSVQVAELSPDGTSITIRLNDPYLRACVLVFRKHPRPVPSRRHESRRETSR